MTPMIGGRRLRQPPSSFAGSSPEPTSAFISTLESRADVEPYIACWCWCVCQRYHHYHPHWHSLLHLPGLRFLDFRRAGRRSADQVSPLFATSRAPSSPGVGSVSVRTTACGSPEIVWTPFFTTPSDARRAVRQADISKFRSPKMGFEVDNKVTKLYVWDAAGQERFRTM
eukprot:GHVU01015586.1.p2 GENE.GHVU01015586.1~~GHVU01015586.1.p2  ORF type:complete len:170 (+),score=5.88 GHVU01015586.1:167-676(+)